MTATSTRKSSSQQQTTAYSDTMLQSLQNIEIIMDDTNGGGINEQLNRFWTSWEDLSNNPSGKLERNALLSTAESLAGVIVSYKQSLDSVNTELNRSIADVVPLINDKIQEIADINAQILKAGANTGDLNNILGQADKRFAGTRFNDQYQLFRNKRRDRQCVHGKRRAPPAGDDGADAQHRRYKRQNRYIQLQLPENVTDSITGGKLGAYMELQHSILPEYIDDLNNMTTALAARVNALHRSGFDADGNIGLDFFSIADRG